MSMARLWASIYMVLRKDIDDFVYVTIGTGVGAGIFANGRPLTGMVHPELGHIRLPRDVAVDSFNGNCAFHGDCLEGLVSGPALEARWNCSAASLPQEHPAWDLEAHYLALMCVNIAMSYSPQRIILGGGVMDQSHLFAAIRTKFAQLMNGYMLPDMALEKFIVAPGLPGFSGEVGALALAMNARDSVRRISQSQAFDISQIRSGERLVGSPGVPIFSSLYQAFFGAALRSGIFRRFLSLLEMTATCPTRVKRYDTGLVKSNFQ